MLLVSLPLVIGNMRQVSMGQRVFVGAFLGAGFYFLSRGFSYIALVFEWPPALAMLAPLLIFIALLGLMLRRHH